MEVTLRKRTSKHTSIHIMHSTTQTTMHFGWWLIFFLRRQTKTRWDAISYTWLILAPFAPGIAKMNERSFSRTQHWHLLFNVEKHPYVTTIIEPMNLTDGMHMGDLCTTGFVTCREDRELSNAICKDNMRRHSSASQMYKQGRPLTLDLFILPQELAASRSTAASQ